MNNWKWFNPTEDPLIVGVDPEVVSGLDAARQQTVDEDPAKKGTPINLTSGLRSAAAEACLGGGVKDSSHLPHPPNGLCMGVDIGVSSDQQMGAILAGLFCQGFRRIGLYYKEAPNGSKIWTHIHADKDVALMAETGPAVWLLKEVN